VLLLTLPVSTATTERVFSTMNIIKTRLRNKIEDEFLTDSLKLFIEKEIATTLSTNSIIDENYYFLINYIDTCLFVIGVDVTFRQILDECTIFVFRQNRCTSCNKK
jgi:hypothetical protein